MRFSLTLGAIFALAASQVLGIAIGSDLESRPPSRIEQRAGTAEPKDVPGSSTGDKYISIDILSVGYLTAAGEYGGDYKIQDYVKKVKGSAKDSKITKIGTNSLARCSLAMLISKRGALMAHLNPDFCTLFLDPNRTDAQKKEDETTPNYAASKKIFKVFQKKCIKYYGEFNKLVGGKYEALIVRGPEQSKNDDGILMLQTLFNHKGPLTPLGLARK